MRPRRYTAQGHSAPELAALSARWRTALAAAKRTGARPCEDTPAWRAEAVAWTAYRTAMTDALAAERPG
jgi:hypothetical protein